jgi:fructosamine-3-kinase
VSWAERIERITGSPVTSSRMLSGGDLGGATRLDLADGRRIVAKQSATAEEEGAMLRAMREAGAPVPHVLHASGELLLMSFLDAPDPPSAAGWRDLARVMEVLHAPAERLFGWPVDHAFGPVRIGNSQTESWTRFWGEHRLLCHAEHVGPVTAARLEALAGRLGDLIPDRPPAALLHGDLWGGNILFSRGTVAALIDPACYYGHREVDVAMLTLFDHPPEEFFAGLSLEEAWRERLPVYRLWPLLVHLRLFGRSYRPAVDRALQACGV